MTTREISLLIAMSACFACVAFDNAKLVAALPSISRNLSHSPLAQRWIVESSLLCYAGLLLIGGTLSERFGARRMLFFGLSGFAVASLLGAQSESIDGLLAARAVSGACAACITPATLATLKHTFDEQKRPLAFAVWTASFGIGAALGPVCSGLLVHHGGFAAVLLANVPPALVCLWASARWVSVDLPRCKAPLDWPGAGLCLSSAACLLTAIHTGPSRGWLSIEALGSGLAGALFLALALTWLRRTLHPLFDLSLFDRPWFSCSLLTILLSYFAFSGVSFVIAQYLQLGRSNSALVAGLLSLPLSGSMLLGTLSAPRWMALWGAPGALAASLAIACAGAVLLANTSVGRNELSLCAALVPFGWGCGSAFVSATELTLGTVPAERAASTAAVSESAFEFGGVLGVAVLSTLLGTPGLSPASVSAGAPGALWAGALSLFLALLLAVSLRISR